jgi:hypothetical protein
MLLEIIMHLESLSTANITHTTSIFCQKKKKNPWARKKGMCVLFFFWWAGTFHTHTHHLHVHTHTHTLVVCVCVCTENVSCVVVNKINDWFVMMGGSTQSDTFFFPFFFSFTKLLFNLFLLKMCIYLLFFLFPQFIFLFYKQLCRQWVLLANPATSNSKVRCGKNRRYNNIQLK